MPTLTLSAESSTGDLVSTNVSANAAVFLTGFFSSMNFQSNFSIASEIVEAQLVLLEQGDIAFLLPGTHLMIFPTGLIIALVWLTAGVAAYGFGTYERVNYRQQYLASQARSKW